MNELINQLLKFAQQIKNELATHANTATRVGTWMENSTTTMNSLLEFLQKYVNEQIAAVNVNVQKWKPAVETVAALPIISDEDKEYTWLCRVTETNTVYQCIAFTGNFNPAMWLIYSTNTDYIDETELEGSITNHNADITAHNNIGKTVSDMGEDKANKIVELDKKIDLYDVRQELRNDIRESSVLAKLLANSLSSVIDKTDVLDTVWSQGILMSNGIVNDGIADWETTDYITNIKADGYLYLRAFFDNLVPAAYANIVLYDKDKNYIDSGFIQGDRCICVPADYFVRISMKVATARAIYFQVSNLSTVLDEFGRIDSKIDSIGEKAGLLTKFMANSASAYIEKTNIIQTTYTDGILIPNGNVITSTTDWEVTDFIKYDNPVGYMFIRTIFDIGTFNYTVNVVLYDKDKNALESATVTGDRCICIPNGYFLRIARKKSVRSNIYYQLGGMNGGRGTILQEIDFLKSDVISTSNVLWTGTSIPAGSSYPKNACKNLGANCINKAIGASFVRFDPTPVSNAQAGYAGLSLSATVAELETKFRPSVTAGTITESQLDSWKQASYENVILPYLDTVDTIVIDHGYNDRYELDNVVAAGKDAIDWSSRDRLTFIGAFNYLLDAIWGRKPFMKIIVGGYFQNTMNDGVGNDARNGEYVCTVLTWIAEHYSLPLLNVWDYAGMGKIYVPNSSNYISDFNTKYGTNYTKYSPDADGNITRFQLYCPDTVHPFSDLTGNSNKILDKVFTKLLRDLL
ncbi:MAG: hypothetical protein LBV74_01125 [Tannerella sp.]|jgi:hypothetical protein|nr:hypothetical protein [Tannerella sp.]